MQDEGGVGTGGLNDHGEIVCTAVVEQFVLVLNVVRLAVWFGNHHESVQVEVVEIVVLHEVVMFMTVPDSDLVRVMFHAGAKVSLLEEVSVTVAVTDEPPMEEATPSAVDELPVDGIGLPGIVRVSHVPLGKLLLDIEEPSVRAGGADDVSGTEEPPVAHEVTEIVVVRIEELLMVIVKVCDIPVPECGGSVVNSDGSPVPEGPMVEFVQNTLLRRVEESDPIIPEALDAPGLDG